MELVGVYNMADKYVIFEVRLTIRFQNRDFSPRETLKSFSLVVSLFNFEGKKNMKSLRNGPPKCSKMTKHEFLLGFSGSTRNIKSDYSKAM